MQKRNATVCVTMQLSACDKQPLLHAPTLVLLVDLVQGAKVLERLCRKEFKPINIRYAHALKPRISRPMWCLYYPARSPSASPRAPVMEGPIPHLHPQPSRCAWARAPVRADSGVPLSR